MNPFRKYSPNTKAGINQLNNSSKLIKEKIINYKLIKDNVSDVLNELNTLHQEYNKEELLTKYFDMLYKAQVISEQAIEDGIITQNEKNAIIQAYDEAEEYAVVDDYKQEKYYATVDTLDELVDTLDELDDEIIYLSERLNRKIRKLQ